jgi:hypothetical protein
MFFVSGSLLIMKNRVFLFISSIVLLFLGGCFISDMPAYINDGKTIVAMLHDENGNSVLWTFDLQSKKATVHSRPGYELNFARMIGEQVWTQWNDGSCCLFDPIKNEFIAGPKKLSEQSWVRNATPASYDSQKCLFLLADRERDADGKMAYDIFTFPDLKKKTAVKLNEVLSAGNFMWVTISVKKIDVQGGKDWELGQVEVFNQEGKQVFSILPEEARKMVYGVGRCRYARINEGEKTLLLFFGEQAYYEFGLFDISNGKFLWGGHLKNEKPSKGNPFVKRNEVWSLEVSPGKTPGMALVRRTPGNKANESKQETILKFSGELRVEEYTPSPDGSHFVAAVNVKGKPSRLMFIPIKEGVTEKDVTSVELSVIPVSTPPTKK